MIQAIKDSGFTYRTLEEKCGISAAQLCRFVNGDRTLTLPTAEKIAEHIGVELKKKEVKHGKSK